jgi:hypothetical protein
MRFARMEPEGAVPMLDGDRTSPNASPKETRTKRALTVLGTANLVSALALAGIDAALEGAGSRRRGFRALLKR